MWTEGVTASCRRWGGIKDGPAEGALGRLGRGCSTQRKPEVSELARAGLREEQGERVLLS